MGNSIIEAQIEFTACIGEITMEHLFDGVSVPLWSKEAVTIQKFIDDHRTVPPHQTIQPVQVNLTKTFEGNNIKYQFS